MPRLAREVALALHRAVILPTCILKLYSNPVTSSELSATDIVYDCGPAVRKLYYLPDLEVGELTHGLLDTWFGSSQA